MKNSSIKGNEIFQSESSPSFKNLRLEEDSPTRIISIIPSQFILSQISGEQFSPSTETPTMKKTSSFKNHILFKKNNNNQNNDDDYIPQILHQQQQHNQQLQQNLISNSSHHKINNPNQPNNIHNQIDQNDGNNNNHQIDYNNFDDDEQIDQEQQEEDLQILQNMQEIMTEQDSFSQQSYCSSSSQDNINMKQHKQNTNQSQLISYEDTQNNNNNQQQKQKCKINTNSKIQQSIQEDAIDKNRKQKKSKKQTKLNKNESQNELTYNIEQECKYNIQEKIYSGNCQYHNQEIQNLVCFTCNEMMCSECINIHIGHKILTINKSYPICKNIISSSLSILNNNIQSLLTQSDDLTSIQNDIIETFQQQKHEIIRACKSIINLIKDQSNQLTQICSNIYNQKLEYIQKENGLIRKELNHLIQSHRIIEKNIILNDPFITCDYFMKKNKIINNILQNSKDNNYNINNNVNHKFYKHNNHTIYETFPQNYQLQINDSQIISQIEREYNKIKFNLNKISPLKNIINNKNNNQSIENSSNDITSNIQNCSMINKINKLSTYKSLSLNSSPNNHFRSRLYEQQSNQKRSSVGNSNYNKDDDVDILNNKLNQFQTSDLKNNINIENDNNNNIQNDSLSNLLFNKNINNHNNKFKNEYYFNILNNQLGNYNSSPNNYFDGTSTKKSLSNFNNTEEQNDNNNIQEQSRSNIDKSKNSSEKFMDSCQEKCQDDSNINRNKKDNNNNIKQISDEKYNKSIDGNDNTKELKLMKLGDKNKNNNNNMISNINTMNVNNNLNQLTNNSSGCSISTRIPNAISKSPSPYKFKSIYQNNNTPSISDNQHQILSINHDNNQIQFNSSLLKSDQIDQMDDNIHQTISTSQFNHINQNNNDYSISKQSNQSFSLDKQQQQQCRNSDHIRQNNNYGDQNKTIYNQLQLTDTTNQERIMKDIAEIKQILYHDYQGITTQQQQSMINNNITTNSNDILQFKRNSLNRNNLRNQYIQQISVSAAHSPNHSINRNGLDNFQLSFQNSFLSKKSINSTPKNTTSTLLGLNERQKSPIQQQSYISFQNYQTQHHNSINQFSLTPKNNESINTTIPLLINKQSEKILKSQFQIEGFLNSIRKDNSNTQINTQRPSSNKNIYLNL